MTEATELHVLIKEVLSAGFSMKDVADKLGVDRAAVVHWSQTEAAKSRNDQAAKISTLKQMLGRNG